MNKNIVKRDGTLEPFNSEKIYKAIKKAFISTNITFKDEDIEFLTNEIVKITNGDTSSVEEVQDLVEKTLMSNGFYDVARHYIIYREERSKNRQYRYAIMSLVPSFNLNKILKSIQKDYPQEEYNLSKLLAKYKTYLTFKMSEIEKMHCLIRAAINLTSLEAPFWDNIAGRLFLVNFNFELKNNLKKYDLNNFYSRMSLYVEKFRYDPTLLTYFSEEDLMLAEKFINKYRDKYLNYSKIKVLIFEYLPRLDEIDFITSFQEFYLLVALICAKNENRSLERVEEIYNSLSKQELSLDNSLIMTILKTIRL